jgi:hypothetical protein
VTAQDLINLAAKDIGVLASGETLAAEEYADALAKLNSLISAWDIEYLNIFCIQENTYALTGSRTTPYLIGPSAADFVAARPISIRAANIISQTGGYTWKLNVVRVEQWAQIIEKAAVGEPPETLYYDNDYPNGKLWLNPWPQSADTLELFTWEQLTQLSSLSSTFDMPPGYSEALEWNLAVSLSPMFGRPLDQQVQAKAVAAKASIRANNAPPGPGNAQVVQATGAAVPIPPDASNAMNR